MPEAPLMGWNNPKAPYPAHYGYQTTHFNIGISFPNQEKGISDSMFLEQERLIRD